MPNSAADNSLFERYVALLGIVRRKPSIDALKELVMAHMTRVPFENISKLYYKKRFQLRQLPDLDRYLTGIEYCNFGGTCFSNNHFINLLLNHLGYDAMLCGADMDASDCHLANIVTVDGREFLIDTGYGAPFLKPLPRDLTHDLEIRLGRDRYVLQPMDERRYSRLDLYRDGKLRHGYTAKTIPRKIEFFASGIESSFSARATFMNSLLVVRQLLNRSTVIYNTTLIQSEGEDFEITRLQDRRMLPEVVEEHMAIPREIVSEALSELVELKNPWS
jgi:arylamine N-acetyltransferase